MPLDASLMLSLMLYYYFDFIIDATPHEASFSLRC